MTENNTPNESVQNHAEQTNRVAVIDAAAEAVLEENLEAFLELAK